jgi:hypothetical protein
MDNNVGVKYKPKRIWLDDYWAVVGLPLKLLVMVVIAGVCLVAILGFIVVSSPHLDIIRIGPINNGDYPEKDCIVCDNLSHEGYYYYRGVKRTIAGYEYEPDPDFSSHLVIRIINDKGDPMADVRVDAEGCGVHSSGVTDGHGYVKLSLYGCYLRSCAIDEIKIIAKHSGTFGEEIKTSSVSVVPR